MTKGRKPIDSPVTQDGDKVICDICDSRIKRNSLSIHIKSKKHQTALKYKPKITKQKPKRKRKILDDVEELEDPFTLNMMSIRPQRIKVIKQPKQPKPKRKPKPIRKVKPSKPAPASKNMQIGTSFQMIPKRILRMRALFLSLFR